MIPEYVLLQRLLQVPELDELVGGRVMPPPRPQSGSDARLPAIVYQRVGGDRFHEHNAPSSFGRARVQYSCFATADADAWAVYEAVRKSIDGWSDRSATPSVQGVTLESPIYQYEQDTKVHHVTVDAIVRYAN